MKKTIEQWGWLWESLEDEMLLQISRDNEEKDRKRRDELREAGKRVKNENR